MLYVGAPESSAYPTLANLDSSGPEPNPNLTEVPPPRLTNLNSNLDKSVEIYARRADLYVKDHMTIC